MSKKLKIDPSAIQKRVSESLSQEKILEQKISEVSTIRFTANYRLANTTLSSFEAYLVCRFGLEKTTRCVGVMKCQLPDTVKTKKIVQCLGEPEEEVTALLGLLKSLESREIQPTQTPTRQILTPPNSTCISCGRQLVVNHLPTTVRIYSLKGLSYGEKWSLRCNGCQLTYSYSKYGSRSGHWNLYPEQRQMVEASDCCLLERKVFEWMASLSNHAWTSFSAFAEAYNETFLPSKDLTEKEVASAFWNGEVELECRELGCLDLFGLWKYDGDREKIMEKIDSKRCNTLYPHPPEDCVEDCKKRGCGRVWVTDGIWKLTFPHCMMQNKNYIQNMPLLNYPDVCTSSCDYGKAFCKEHCLEVEKAGYPTDIKGFLRACSTKGQQANSLGDAHQSHLDEHEEYSKKLSESVDEVVIEIASPDVGETVFKSQGMEKFALSNKDSINEILENCVEDNPSVCRKNLGETKRMRHWSRGHQFVVRAGGHIDTFQPLYKSESPSQVFLIVITWLYNVLKDMPVTLWGNVVLVYDNMCHLDGLKAAKRRLPFSKPWDGMWQVIGKVLDRFHYGNHTDKICREKYDPNKFLLQDDNSEVAEQTFVWAGRFKKIICAMPKVHHLFFMHRMVKRRNAYTVRCYKSGQKPLLPKVKKGKKSY